MEKAEVHASAPQKANEGGWAANYFRNIHDKPQLTPERLPTLDPVKQVITPRHYQHEFDNATQLEKPVDGVLILVGDGIYSAAAILANKEKTNSSTKGLNVK